MSSQKEEITLLGEDKKIYRQTRESLPMVMNREPEVEYRINGSDGRIWYFDVPAELQSGSFQLSVPSVTLISSEESGVIILPLTGEKSGKEGVSDREILFKDHGLEIVSMEATGGKGTFGPDKESVSDPDLGGRFIFYLPYEEGDDSITFQLWHPYYVWEQPFSLEISVS